MKGMNKIQAVPGGIALSTQGRDRGRYYLIKEVLPGGYVLVCDGEGKKTCLPEKEELKTRQAVARAGRCHRRKAGKRQQGVRQRGIFGAQKLLRAVRRRRRARNLAEERFVSKNDVIEAEGRVIECLPNANFKVQLANGYVITAYISGKLRMNYIRIIEGDMVKLEMSPYDLTKGRITWRSKS